MAAVPAVPVPGSELQGPASDVPAAAAPAPGALRKALPTVVCTAVIAAAVVWQRDAVGTGIHTLLTADPKWLVVALLATLGLWPTSVLMLRGSIPAQTCSRRLFALQLAVPAIGLIPAAALLIRLRFLRRAGLSHTAAVASMTLFGFAAFAVRIPLVVVALLATPALIDRTGAQAPWHDLGSKPSGLWHSVIDNPWRTAAFVAVSVLVATGLFVTGALMLRRRIAAQGGWRGMFARLRHARHDAAHAWKSVASTAFRPRRAAALWLCALAQPLLMVIALWAVLHAVGADLSLADTFVVELVTVALAPLLPSPNGVGSKEITIAAGLTAVAGLSGGVAVAAALGFRLLTFWCQIPLGVASFAWLSHRRAI
ncbi:flippase-like domain-containing protein [Nocardia yamanashiensis]|uniref:lysylphosphatidylglycerol synthase transmembrane domain-containing protein n=1 Tax=Nocardia yamanashiensis TaxID=209247 RepID=UPI00082A246F|nr:lysylphosphatidylglycerol synthase domain-containing protein [Nocardia yamanashiensis]UGT42453.1 flippase-like domain-containing protein [Nocardia yamanashiensis]